MSGVTEFAMFGSWESERVGLRGGPRYVVGARALINGESYGASCEIVDPLNVGAQVWDHCEKVLRRSMDEAAA